MVFNDSTTKLGICQEIDALCDSDTTSYPVADKTRRVNAALEEVIGDLIALDKNWKFDDSNHTNLPIGTATLVNGQQDYSFDSSVLAVERVEVEDADGVWHKLSPINEKYIEGALDEYEKTNGLPLEYAVRANSIFLYPTPATASVTLVAGLKVYFQRTAHLFTASDTTAVPGFASPYHIILAYKAALPYCQTYKKDRVPMIVNEISRLERKMFAFASNKMNDKLPRLSVRQEDNR